MVDFKRHLKVPGMPGFFLEGKKKVIAIEKGIGVLGVCRYELIAQLGGHEPVTAALGRQRREKHMSQARLRHTQQVLCREYRAHNTHTVAYAICTSNIQLMLILC